MVNGIVGGALSALPVHIKSSANTSGSSLAGDASGSGANAGGAASGATPPNVQNPGGPVGKAPSAAAAPAAGGASASPAVTALEAIVKRLQKQLADLEKAAAQASQDPSPGGGANVKAATLQSEISSTIGALETATAALAQAMLASGSTTGMVNTQA
jgi:hypothetical protein